MKGHGWTRLGHSFGHNFLSSSDRRKATETRVAYLQGLLMNGEFSGLGHMDNWRIRVFWKAWAKQRSVDGSFMTRLTHLLRRADGIANNRKSRGEVRPASTPRGRVAAFIAWPGFGNAQTHKRLRVG
jgi:hypothetical protein